MNLPIVSQNLATLQHHYSSLPVLQQPTCLQQPSWSTYLQWLEYSHNSLVSSATGMSPFMISNGFQPPLFPSHETEVAVPSVQAHFRCSCRVWREARAALVRTVARNQRIADKHRTPAAEYKVGQQVWLYSKDLPLQTESRKMAPRYIGPYIIERIINPSAVRLRLPAALKVHPILHVSLLKPVFDSTPHPPSDPPPPLCLIDGHPVFTVNRFLDVRRRGHGYQFLVEWEGYATEERSWISRSLVLHPSLLTDFYHRFPDKPGRTTGGVP